MSEQAVRHPKRGKAHRQSWPRPSGYYGSTDCGKFARDMTENIPVEHTAPEDRCRQCWRGSDYDPTHTATTPAEVGDEEDSDG